MSATHHVEWERKRTGYFYASCGRDVRGHNSTHAMTDVTCLACIRAMIRHYTYGFQNWQNRYEEARAERESR